MEKSHRQVLTSLGLLSHPESNEYICFSFVLNSMCGNVDPRFMWNRDWTGLLIGILSCAQECSNSVVLIPSYTKKAHTWLVWWTWVWVAAPCWWAKRSLTKYFPAVFASKHNEEPFRQNYINRVNLRRLWISLHLDSSWHVL